MMSVSILEWVQFLLYFVVLFGLAWPLGIFMARIYEGVPTFLSPGLGQPPYLSPPVE
ncbi:MAG: hypothetical protein KA099_11890 [Alphaproteobacteria bacterium]|nr:hypothetical protein [Alphaproteobacteria bacterium]MBP7763504.1 hypothetical protein [Alphaproteobacteria bacterium]MBP7906012.1 hypothetical protein [Alphaproteobacteria bacterium]